VPYLAFFNLFLAIGFGRKLLSSPPEKAPAAELLAVEKGRVALGPLKRCPMTGQVGMCPASAAPRPSGPVARAVEPEEDPEIIVFVDKPPARPGPGLMRLTQAVLVLWSLATAVVAFTTWHSRSKVPLLSATFALTALSMLRE
jgi:hypothetical protein